MGAIEHIKDVDDDVQTLHREASSLQNSAQQVVGMLGRHPEALKGYNAEAWVFVAQQIHECRETLQEMEDKLSEIERDTRARRSKLRRVIKTASLAKRMKAITKYKGALHFFSSSLQIGLHITTM